MKTQNLDQAMSLVQSLKSYTNNYRPLKQNLSSQLLKAASLIQDNQGKLAKLITAEVYKNSEQASSEVLKTIDLINHTAHECSCITSEYYTLPDCKEARLIYEPVGLVLAIAPYNFPLYTLCHKVIPALAAGNACIIKPSPHASEIAYELYKIF